MVAHYNVTILYGPSVQSRSNIFFLKQIKVKFDEEYVKCPEANPCKYHCVAITGIKPAGWLGTSEERYEIKNYGGQDDKHRYIPVNLPFVEVMQKEFNDISQGFNAISGNLSVLEGIVSYNL